METWGFEARHGEVPGERFGLLTDDFGLMGPRTTVLQDAGVDVDELKKVKDDKEALLTRIRAEEETISKKLEKSDITTDDRLKLKAALAELTKLETNVSGDTAGRADAPPAGGRTVRTASGGDDHDTEDPLADDPEVLKARKDFEIAKYKRGMKQMGSQGTAEDLALGASAINIGQGLFGGGGGSFVSAASSGPGGSLGITSGSGGFGGFGVAPFGAPGGMLGIASPGGGSGAMGPGDVLFNIGAPMMTSGANGFGEEIRQQNRKLEALINFLLMQILSGNTDAITSALIAVSRKSKGTLILSSVGMISAMKQYDQQQAKISETFQNLQFDAGNPDSMARFQHQSQNLSMQLNGIAVARQMLMNQMRDVLTMSEEIGNVEKSILDIVGQFKRHYSRFNV